MSKPPASIDATFRNGSMTAVLLDILKLSTPDMLH